MDEKEKQLPSAEDFLLEEPPLAEEPAGPMPELNLEIDAQEQEDILIPAHPAEEILEPVILCPPEDLEADTFEDTPAEEILEPVILCPPENVEPDSFEDTPMEDPVIPISEEPILMPILDEPAEEIVPMPILEATAEEIVSEWDAPSDESDPFFSAESAAPAVETANSPTARYRSPRKGRPKRKKGYGLFGLPHLLATFVWLGIIVMIGTSLGRMLWVCAADVLAFGRESKKVSVTITSNDTIDDIAEKLHDAELVRYPGLFKFYASLAVDDGDILPGTFEMDTLYDYHALVVQMGPRSSTRAVVEDLLIPEGLNCRQIFELLEQHNICTVAELEEYAASGEFTDFWFLDGVERGDKYCLEGFLFPDTYDFYEHSTPREALGKMLLGFEARVDQEETMTALTALNERLSGMMRTKGCSEDHIAQHQLSLRDLLTVASLIEEETASSKESPMIASVIFNRLTEDQVYERYLNIDAAIIYATGDANNIDTSIDHPYNTYKNAGLTPGPISNPGLESITAALYFEDSPYYYYVLNPETQVHQFSKTLAEHEEWVEKFRGMAE